MRTRITGVFASSLLALGLLAGGPATSATADSIPSLSTCTNIVMGTGAKGACVKSLQHSLAGYGYILDVDGVYGSETRATVLAFQRVYHLAEDGIAGPQTIKALDRWANAPHPDPDPRQAPNPERAIQKCGVTGCTYYVSKSGTRALDNWLNDPETNLAADLTSRQVCGAAEWVTKSLGAFCDYQVILGKYVLSTATGNAVANDACLAVKTTFATVGGVLVLAPAFNTDKGNNCTP
ncbi:peptidoglycan-binding domain-containing protein [Streptomyces spongiae]|uniref:Peptidoglycan-binding protein n=1 Tax=Streptomyces spongiae TaxID=565072 RepID=A0A5N8XPT5_9ACTN|nr:peptidoglycan-binding domain-containing protein [Streptomyces spongiae]MPY61500.1 peptidoglycan-binding protein [Streptomyces spongiae]